MIYVGLAGWGDHDRLYPEGIKSQLKLQYYAKHFSVVEVDSSFYAVLRPGQFEKWVESTPPGFRFVVKAYQGMTGHSRRPVSFPSEDDMFEAFKQSVQPVIDSGKLLAVLFQYPPYFDCTRANVAVLRAARARMGHVPVAVEFRHRSWFTPEMTPRTLAFMAREGWLHSVCDEPQAGEGSVPIVAEGTHPDLTIVRMHGRNAAGWNNPGAGDRNWREVRYLYRYNEEELTEWRQRLEYLQTKSRNICVIFNNNSGGDAADNAKQFMRLLGIDNGPDIPEQLDLFQADN